MPSCNIIFQRILKNEIQWWARVWRSFFVRMERNMFHSGTTLGSLHKPRYAKRFTYYTLHSASLVMPTRLQGCLVIPQTALSKPPDAKWCTRLPRDTKHSTRQASWCQTVHETSSWYHIHSARLMMLNCAQGFVIPLDKPCDAKQCTQQASCTTLPRDTTHCSRQAARCETVHPASPEILNYVRGFLVKYHHSTRDVNWCMKLPRNSTPCTRQALLCQTVHSRPLRKPCDAKRFKGVQTVIRPHNGQRIP